MDGCGMANSWIPVTRYCHLVILVIISCSPWCTNVCCGILLFDRDYTCFVRQLFAEQCLGRMPESSQRVAWIEGSDPGIPRPWGKHADSHHRTIAGPLQSRRCHEQPVYDSDDPAWIKIKMANWWMTRGMESRAGHERQRDSLRFILKSRGRQLLCEVRNRFRSWKFGLDVNSKN